MSEATAAIGQKTESFNALDEALRASGPAAVLDALIHQLDERKEFRPLLDALLLKARHDLGLPLVQAGGFSEIPEALRSSYEDRYVAAVRTVGAKLLAEGDIPNAWPYFRAIGETEPVVKAIDAYEPADDDPRLSQIVEVAFNQGANPAKGFALILKQYGTCSAITAFEHLPRDESIRALCADRLVRQLHDHLDANLRAEISQRGQPLQPEGAPIADLILGREWLFVDDSYHVDVSHLSATVRVSPLLTDPATLALAADLCAYGRQLSPRHRYEGDPPFEDVYVDHGIFLDAIQGREVDTALAHFQAKLIPPPNNDPENETPFDPSAAQVLVGLLVRLGRLDQAIDIAAQYLAGIPEGSLFCPGVSQLCQRSGQLNRLAQIARDQGDLVHYAAAIIQSEPSHA